MKKDICPKCGRKMAEAITCYICPDCWHKISTPAPNLETEIEARQRCKEKPFDTISLENWGIEFDKKFQYPQTPSAANFRISVKLFIHQILQKQREELIGEIENYIKQNKGINPLPTIGEEVAREIIEIIRKNFND